MIKKLQTFILTIASSLMLLAPALLAPTLAHAAEPDIQGSVNCGADLEIKNGGCVAPNTTNDLNDTIAMVINIFSFAVGIIAVIMIIIGGIRFVLSGGDSTATTSARNTVLYAVVGLVVAILAQVIVHFVLNRFE